MNNQFERIEEREGKKGENDDVAFSPKKVRVVVSLKVLASIAAKGVTRFGSVLST